MPGVYSAVLAAGRTSQGTNSVLFTVPPGETWVVREINSVVPGSITNGEFQYFVQVGSSVYQVIHSTAVVSNTPQQWSGRLVVQTGALMACSAVTGGLVTYISGYRLLGTPPV